MKNKIIWTFILIVCFNIIFAFSHQNGITSEKLSDGVSESIINVISKIFDKEIDYNNKLELIKKLRKIVRKSAHFLIYLILGIIMYFTLKNYGVKELVLFSILSCFLYACLDELHQTFISERAGRFLDVFLDTSGACLGILLTHYIKKKKCNL